MSGTVNNFRDGLSNLVKNLSESQLGVRYFIIYLIVICKRNIVTTLSTHYKEDQKPVKCVSTPCAKVLHDLYFSMYEILKVRQTHS